MYCVHIHVHVVMSLVRERVGWREGKEMCGKRYVEIRKEKEKGRDSARRGRYRTGSVCEREREGRGGGSKEGLTEEEGSVRRRFGRRGRGGGQEGDRRE